MTTGGQSSINPVVVFIFLAIIFLGFALAVALLG